MPTSRLLCSVAGLAVGEWVDLGMLAPGHCQRYDDLEKPPICRATPFMTTRYIYVVDNTWGQVNVPYQIIPCLISIDMCQQSSGVFSTGDPVGELDGVHPKTPNMSWR